MGFSVRGVFLLTKKYRPQKGRRGGRGKGRGKDNGKGEGEVGRKMGERERGETPRHRLQNEQVLKHLLKHTFVLF